VHTDFVCYVIEEYKKEKGMDGKSVISLFVQNNIISFIEKCYPALHMVGADSIISDIDAIAASKV